MRMIEQFFQALARILFKKTNKNYDGAIDEINLAYKKLFGLESELINSLPDFEIIYSSWLNLSSKNSHSPAKRASKIIRTSG